MSKHHCHPERSRRIYAVRHRAQIPPLRFASVGMTLLCLLFFFASPLQAEEKKETQTKEESPAPDAAKAEENPARFAPDFCDFEITFPEEPAIAKKCVGDSGCYDLNSYTMVYDLQTTVDVSVTCNPSTPAAYEKYNDAVMKAALSGMIDDRELATHEIQFHQIDENTRTAALTGSGARGRQDMLYSAQLWIGKNSVFTIQAELIGSAHEKADKEFSDILKSIKVKGGKQLPKPKEFKAKSN